MRSAKLLGTWIDNRLTWETHVKKLMTKLRCGIGMLQRSQNLLTCKAKKLLYFGQLHSNLCYCLSIWGTMIKKKLMTDITRLQCNAVKLIDKSVPTDKVFIKLSYITLRTISETGAMQIGL